MHVEAGRSQFQRERQDRCQVSTVIESTESLVYWDRSSRPLRCFRQIGAAIVARSNNALTAMGDFLRSLRRNVQNEPDPDVPVLMKNQTQAIL